MKIIKILAGFITKNYFYFELYQKTIKINKAKIFIADFYLPTSHRPILWLKFK